MCIKVDKCVVGGVTKERRTSHMLHIYGSFFQVVKEEEEEKYIFCYINRTEYCMIIENKIICGHLEIFWGGTDILEEKKLNFFVALKKDGKIYVEVMYQVVKYKQELSLGKRLLV